MERYLIIGFGRRELTPEEIAERDAFIKYLREKEATEKEVVDNLNLLANSIVTRMEPIKEFRLPKILENPKHWTSRNWKKWNGTEFVELEKDPTRED